uniref:UDENN domain-containing protein n=1 Tax=Amphiprion ocellaris TaxID=80972 RepID=A0AAQ5ZMK2_AMPOC
MAHRKSTFDHHSNDNALLVGTKLPRSNRGNIKDKISLWEGKEPTHSPLTSGTLGQCVSVKRTESLTKTDNESIGKSSTESSRRVAHKDTHYLGKENVGDSRPCSPVELGKQQRGTLNSSKSIDNQTVEDYRRVVVHKETQDHEKENVEKLGDLRPCSPTATEKQQVGTLRKSNDRRAAEQASQEKRAIFSLFKKLESMGENLGKTPPELGNYFSPPSKDKQVEVKKKQSEAFGRSNVARDVKECQENVYTEPGMPPINPVPKPRRTFQHPATAPIGKRQGRGQRNLPPLPSISSKTSSKPPSGIYGRPRGQTVRDNINRYAWIRKMNFLLIHSHKFGCQVSAFCSSRNISSCFQTDTELFQQVVLRINGIFEARNRKKPLRRIYHYAETSSGRVTDENSDSESEVEERAKAHRQRLTTVQSILSQPNQAQVHFNGTNTRNCSVEQRKLFEYFLVVSLQKSKAGGHYLPEVTQQFPPKLERSFKFMRETEDQLRIIPQFCFPDAKDWEPVETYPSDFLNFVLIFHLSLQPSGKGKRLPEVYCIVSHLGCFNLFSKVLDEVERRRALSPALVQPFMRAIMEAQFPAPGRTINIKTFLPGSGTEVMELCRPSDSRLEHVDFECLFSCLSLRLLLRVFGSLLLERRVIFTAEKLSTLSQCCHAVVALLYPFVWQHTYIPVLPSAMLDIVCTPTPFIVGLLSSSLPQLTELPLEEVLVVDLGNSRFLRQLDDEDSILPSKLQTALENVLERRRELANERGGDITNDSGHLSTVVSEAFVRFFVELVGHYPLFITSEREDAIPSKTVRRFLEVFMETQMFGWFIQERELHRQALRGLFEVRVQEYLDSIHENEHRRVNRFLKGLGNKMKFLSKK